MPQLEVKPGSNTQKIANLQVTICFSLSIRLTCSSRNGTSISLVQVKKILEFHPKKWSTDILGGLRLKVSFTTGEA